MENGQKRIGTLFGGRTIFNIPKYQRAYAWEDKQLEDFVDDILNQDPDKDYFFGTILLQEKGVSNSGFEIIDIVDGQQRITTLMIFIKLLLDHLKDHNVPTSMLEETYIQYHNEHRLNVLQDDNDFFKSYILQDNPISVSEVETPSQRRLLKAKNFLRQRLEKYPLNILQEFKEKIERTKVLTYSVEDNAEATLIFETTNDRGKSLTNLEKTKSFLMYKTYLVSEYTETTLEDLQSRFGNIYRNYEEIENRVGEDAILQYHFIAFEKWTPSRNREYQQPVQMIKKQVNDLVNGDNKSEAMNFIARYSRELKESFLLMKTLLMSSEPHLLDIFALNRPATFYPLLVKSYKFDDSPRKKNFKQVVRLIEIICFRLGIGPYKTNKGREKLYNEASNFNGNFEQLINNLTEFIDDYCNDRDFHHSLLSPRFYKEDEDNKDQLYLFWKYENHLRTEEQPIYPEMSYDEFVNRDPRTKFSIEHIIPQNPREGKVIMEGSESILPEITQEFKDEYLHCIGNLTIDPLSSNISKSNHPFEYKDQNYFHKAPLKTQNELTDFLNPRTDRWDEYSICKRRDKILKFAETYWNHKYV